MQDGENPILEDDMPYKFRLTALVLFFPILLLLSCSLSNAAEQAPADVIPGSAESVKTGNPAVEETAGPATKTAAPTAKKTVAAPTPDITIPDPDPDKASVAGRILWNEQPAADLEVRLCEDMSLVSGCKGEQFSIRTDADGVYLFANITPGSYALAVEAFDGQHWMYIKVGLGIGAEKYEVLAGQTLRIADQSIFKFDLIQTSPGENEKIAAARPTLTWDPYPDAAYYEVYLTQENGGAIFVSERTEEASITPQSDLLTCSYTWQVEAFNSRGSKLAEQDDYSHFKIVDQPLSCYLDAVAPANGASVHGSGIVLEWKQHELADYYRIHLWDAEYTDLLDGMKVDGPSYPVPQTVAPGQYRWYVTAYDSDDHEFARSEFIEFTITE
jgi:hypothetical protein